MALRETPFIFNSNQTDSSNIQLTDYLVNITSCHHLENVTDKILYGTQLKYTTEVTVESELLTQPPLKEVLHYTGETTCPTRRQQPEKTNYY